MLHLVLFEPRIPPNTGTIGRLCLATTTPLHLIEPLGFSLEDKYLKRAGLDYWPRVDLHVWPNLAAYLAAHPERRIIATSSRRPGLAYHLFPFRPGDSLLLGPEDTGLPEEVWSRFQDRVSIPFWGQVRSLNLANAAAVLVYEFYRRTGRLDRE